MNRVIPPEPSTASKSESRLSASTVGRMYLIFAVLAFFALAAAARILYVQIFEAERWREKQAAHKVTSKVIRAHRGSILADDGSILATTIHRFRLAVDATVLDEKNFANFQDSLDLLCRRLSEMMAPLDGAYTPNYFKDKLLLAKAKNDRHVYLTSVKDLFSHKQVKAVQSLPIFNRTVGEGGLIVEPVEDKRFYPLGGLAQVTLGSLDENGMGVKGLEYAFNAQLAGRDGRAVVQRVGGGVEIPVANVAEIEPKDGFDLATTLNVNMQDVVWQALKTAVEKHRAEGGVAILMETRTGHIKAIANYPETFNQATAAQLEPGSTFKLATAIAVLESGQIRPDDTIATGDGAKQYYDRTMTDVKPYGKITFREAFEKSSNIAFAEVVQSRFGDQPQLFIEQIRKTGILSHTQFDLKGEPEPYIITPDQKFWSMVTLPWMAIGYNVKLTPLQLLTFYNAVANDGVMVRPMLVKEVLDFGTVRQSFETRTLNPRICSPSTLTLVRQMLEGVVETGSAQNIQSRHFKIAGKTGTALTVVGGAYHKKYRSSFVGYFPADKPMYSCYVMIDKPQSGEYYGAEVAAPVFKEIAENVYAMYVEMRLRQENQNLRKRKIAPPTAPVAHAPDAKVVYDELGVAYADLPGADWVRLKAQDDGAVAFRPYKFSYKGVPNFRGMTAKDALALAENVGLKPQLRGSGRVVRQSLPSDGPLRRGQTITLHLQ
ncbi:MAG: penicillin-binding protein [Bacteroidia bacterium]|nr:transpeptidase family protein [Bacteroidia bacterium]MDW8333824.1 penicillin-binding protein [Bacteroidia bacterium]